MIDDYRGLFLFCINFWMNFNYYFSMLFSLCDESDSSRLIFFGIEHTSNRTLMASSRCCNWALTNNSNFWVLIFMYPWSVVIVRQAQSTEWYVDKTTYSSYFHNSFPRWAMENRKESALLEAAYIYI